MFKMLWDAPTPAGDPAPRRSAWARSMPSRPWRWPPDQARPASAPRTIELGEYFGIFEGQSLVAMAGERACAGRLRGNRRRVHPPQPAGRGWARALMLKLIGRQLRRGETPVLHVMRDNAAAHGLYLRVDFRDHRESVVRIIAPR
ncbi:MAG: GNAT family N-acetyltransferase [Burkholderiaceae bacterium]